MQNPFQQKSQHTSLSSDYLRSSVSSVLILNFGEFARTSKEPQVEDLIVAAPQLKEPQFQRVQQSHLRRVGDTMDLRGDSLLFQVMLIYYIQQLQIKDVISLLSISYQTAQNTLFSIIRNQQIMNFQRKVSKNTLRLTSEDVSTCLDQKNNMITSLQIEVDELRVNQQRYDQIKDELMRSKNKYEMLLRDQETVTNSNQERMELTNKNLNQQKIHVEHLEQEFRIRQQSLKEAKYQSQLLMEEGNIRQDELSEVQIRGEELKSLKDVKKMEEERSKMQICQLREEVQKQRKENLLTKAQASDLAEKTNKTQSYIRNLIREEIGLNENLTKMEDENNAFDRSLGDLETLITIKNSEKLTKEKDIQECRFMLATTQLEKKKIDNQSRERIKNLALEKQKWRNLSEQHDQKRHQGIKLDHQMTEASEDINFILSKNTQIFEINNQLKSDLTVCQRHLENVLRNNKILEEELQKMQELNGKAIKKLEEPMRKEATQWNRTVGKWSASSRMTNYQTGEFQNWK